jgi:hypothetical protein
MQSGFVETVPSWGGPSCFSDYYVQRSFRLPTRHLSSPIRLQSLNEHIVWPVRNASLADRITFSLNSLPLYRKSVHCDKIIDGDHWALAHGSEWTFEFDADAHWNRMIGNDQQSG